MLQSQLFAGDAVLQAVADDTDRISTVQHRTDPAVGKLQQALLMWDPSLLPTFGADGEYGSETAGAVHQFKARELGVAEAEIVDDVGPRTVIRLDEIALAKEQPVPPVPPPVPPVPTPVAVLTRMDVNGFQQDATAWDDHLLAYAFAVGRMKEERPTDPTSWHWSYQTQVHGAGTDPGDGFRHQCQHNCWYFLPWHRMYLLQFERIVRTIIGQDPRVSDAVKADWALPYWDYDQPTTRSLPFAFRTQTLPDGSANPLFESNRLPGVNDMSTPVALQDFQVSSVNWITNQRFTGLSSFGGATTGRNHNRETPGNAGGQLEGAPHGAVHNFVGGRMGDFNQAAGDAIFWLHHCNIDRLWEVWRIDVGAGADPVDPAWMTSLSWTFRDPADATVTQVPADVLDTVNQLGYQYQDTSRPASAPPPSGGLAVPASPARLIGSIDSPMSLVSGNEAPVAVSLTDMPADLGPDSHLTLVLDHISADGGHLPQYGVFLDPDGTLDESLYIGLLSMFGINNPDETDLRYAFDVTDLVNRLIADGRFDLSQAKLRFAPIDQDSVNAAVEGLGITIGSITIGSVSLFIE